jgi:SlyX protein
MEPTDTTHLQDTTDQRLTELEIKASFSEDLLDQLNQVIVRQQQQIDQLIREIGHLRQRGTDATMGVSQNPLDDLPPHY